MNFKETRKVLRTQYTYEGVTFTAEDILKRKEITCEAKKHAVMCFLRTKKGKEVKNILYPTVESEARTKGMLKTRAEKQANMAKSVENITKSDKETAKAEVKAPALDEAKAIKETAEAEAQRERFHKAEENKKHASAKYDSDKAFAKSEAYKAPANNFTANGEKGVELKISIFSYSYKIGKKSDKIMDVETSIETYGDEYGEYAKELEKLNKELEKLQSDKAEAVNQLSKIGYKLTDRDINKATAISFKSTRVLGTFKGETEANFNNVASDVKEVIDAYTDRFSTVKKPAGGWIQLLNDKDYKAIKNALNYYAVGLYGKHYNFNGKDIDAVMVGARAFNKGKVRVKKSAKIKEVLIDVVNVKYFAKANKAKASAEKKNK